MAAATPGSAPIRSPSPCPAPAREPELLLDMATSAIAFGKARVARNKGVPVPEGVLIDEHGRPTTDPTTYVDTRRGALLAFGAHKGSGLAIMCEVLGGGGDRAAHHARRITSARTASSTACSPSSSTPPPWAIRRTSRPRPAAVGDWVKASPPAPGFAGDSAARAIPSGAPAPRRLAEGVPIDDKSLADILAAVASLGVSRAELDRTLGR